MNLHVLHRRSGRPVNFFTERGVRPMIPTITIWEKTPVWITFRIIRILPMWVHL
jgi:hypothetical protein